MAAESEEILDGSRRNYWTGSPEDLKRLGTFVMRGMKALARQRADEMLIVRGEQKAAFCLPVEI
ncbi:hypothetical protein [Micromonospora sp. MW-13]|uniref:hypothetical protein n=1 Tax=Micromonospora sp. MW-13 TaxID=2094022 RepID=UPI000FFEB0FC|nr:hypothetical protein [Micromonospora sp. MW-13]